MYAQPSSGDKRFEFCLHVHQFPYFGHVSSKAPTRLYRCTGLSELSLLFYDLLVPKSHVHAQGMGL